MGSKQKCFRNYIVLASNVENLGRDRALTLMEQLRPSESSAVFSKL